MTFTRTCIGTLATAIVATTAVAAPSEFSQALAADYQSLSAAEQAQGDSQDAGTYAARAKAAADGTPTEPDSPALRQGFLKERHVADLTQGRGRLVTALNEAGGDKAPMAAARAQATYDCWLEQATEDLQPADIAACKDAFLAAIETVETAIAVVPVAVAQVDEVAPPAPAPAPPVPQRFSVHFGFDQDTVSAAGRAVLEEVKTAVGEAPVKRLLVVGHASTIGSTDYNMRLSQRRAEEVKKILLDMSVDADSIVAEARGEAMLVVDTPDGTREPRNRVVQITIER